MKFLTDNTSQIRFFTGGTTNTTSLQRMVIDANGNVGIGNASPIAPLHITGPSNPAILVSSTAPTGGAAFLAIATAANAYSNSALAGDVVLRAHIWNQSKLVITNNAFSSATYGFTEAIVFATGLQSSGDEKTRVRIFANGVVAIGDLNNNNEFPAGTVFNTATPYKLYVAQGILTPKLKIGVPNTANWSDFVFAKDYKLRPLSEVESFITHNKHLPEVPSASDVVSNGIDVAKMDAILLQKIEELTLYLIEMKKENEKISKEMEALKAKK